MSTALAPGGKAKSGVSPLVESPRFLRDHALDGYEAIFLLNFERLDETELSALEAYVRAGGGLAIFLGELNRTEFVNKYLYRDGQGLFPLPLVGPTELLVDRTEEVPDLEVGDHPMFSVFAGQRNSFIGTVLVERYFAAVKNWKPADESATEVIARLRNGAPLAVEGRYGDGRVVAFLTKAGAGETPQGAWNNWGRTIPATSWRCSSSRLIWRPAGIRRRRAWSVRPGKRDAAGPISSRRSASCSPGSTAAARSRSTRRPTGIA